MPCFGLQPGDRTHFGGNWYDFSMTRDTSAEWLRRYAWHIENGQPSVSDPAMTAA